MHWVKIWRGVFLQVGQGFNDGRRYCLAGVMWCVSFDGGIYQSFTMGMWLLIQWHYCLGIGKRRRKVRTRRENNRNVLHESSNKETMGIVFVFLQ